MQSQVSEIGEGGVELVRRAGFEGAQWEKNQWEQPGQPEDGEDVLVDPAEGIAVCV